MVVAILVARHVVIDLPDGMTVLPVNAMTLEGVF